MIVVGEEFSCLISHAPLGPWAQVCINDQSKTVVHWPHWHETQSISSRRPQSLSMLTMVLVMLTLRRGEINILILPLELEACSGWVCPNKPEMQWWAPD